MNGLQLSRSLWPLCLLIVHSVSAAHRGPASIADCADPKNRIVEENCKPGSPATEWDINGAGDPSIQGFGTDISVNVGERIEFKVKTDAPDYRLDIYRYQSDALVKFINFVPACCVNDSCVLSSSRSQNYHTAIVAAVHLLDIRVQAGVLSGRRCAIARHCTAPCGSAAVPATVRH